MPAMSMQAKGRCLCGKVTFTAEGVEAHHHACHCGICRRWSGGAPFFGTSARHVTFNGSEHLRRFASSDWAERGFCTFCGSHLFYFLKPSQSYTLCVGAFEDSAAFQLTREIFVDQKPAGYALTGDHPRVTEAEVWAAYESSQQ